MKKIIGHTAFFALLFSFTGTNAQNTATTSGNWDNCATWGNPASIIQNTTDSKTINGGVNVVQNTAWSTGGIILNGTGSVTFASSSNAVDFITDGGGDQSCCTVVTPSTFSVTQPNCNNNKRGTIVFNTQASSEYSINNGVSYQLGTTFSNLDPATYSLKVRNTGNTSCTSSTINVILNNVGTCTVFDYNWDCSGFNTFTYVSPASQAVSDRNCWLSIDNLSNSSISSGYAYKTVNTVVGRTYILTIVGRHVGNLTSFMKYEVFNGGSPSGTVLGSRDSMSQATYTLSFTASSTSATIKVSETGSSSSSSDQYTERLYLQYN